MNRVTAALLGGLLLVQAAPARAADAPPAGNWKVVLPFQGGADALWLVKVEKKDGKWSGDVIGSRQDKLSASMSDFAVDGDALRFSLKLKDFNIPFEGKLPKDGDKILGSITLQGKVNPARLERTALTSLDPFEVSKETLTTKAGEAEAVGAALELLGLAAEKKVKPEEARAWADKAIEWSKAYGPAWQNEITLSVADSLGDQEGFGDLALEYARKAEKTLAKGDKPAYQRRVLKALAAALTKAKKDDEAKAVTERLEKIDALAVTPYPGRKADSDRVAVVELFTGAQCPPCVTADTAFDALNQTYKPGDVVFLEYHLHIPRGDPLTVPDNEERAKFYKIEGTPTLIVNGKEGPPAGGRGEDEAQDKYDEYNHLLQPLLEKPAKAHLKLTTKFKDGKSYAKVDWSDLAEMGDNVRLRLALVEPEIAYTGSNKVSMHHDVVRGFVGEDGVKGTALKEKAGNQITAIDLTEQKKKVQEATDNAVQGVGIFGKAPPVELKDLRLVAFVQNEDTGEILQAVQADLATK